MGESGQLFGEMIRGVRGPFPFGRFSEMEGVFEMYDIMILYIFRIVQLCMSVLAFSFGSIT